MIILLEEVVFSLIDHLLLRVNIKVNLLELKIHSLEVKLQEE
jgi:hypothetical protein